MPSIRIEILREDLPFGSRVFGASLDNLSDEAARQQILAAFEDRGLLLFEQIEPSVELHLAISRVFGSLKEHPDPVIRARTSVEGGPGIVELVNGPDTDRTLVELEGRPLSNWLPWHFDLPYNNEINRAGVLRPVVISPDGRTGFADGIQLYNSLPPDLRKRIEGLNVIYTMDHLLEHMRFGKPANIRPIQTARSWIQFASQAATMPRSLHPAVWQRQSGEKVLHVSGIHAVGIEGHEDPNGDGLLEEICQAIMANPLAYYHAWQSDQMIAWDNWRVLHCVTGTDPKYLRRMHRTTIEGDYGLGRFEQDRTGGRVLETVL